MQNSRRCFNIRTHHLQNNTVEGRRQQENNISHQPKIIDHELDHTLPLWFMLLTADLTTRPLDLDTGVTAGVHRGPGTRRADCGDQEQAA